MDDFNFYFFSFNIMDWRSPMQTNTLTFYSLGKWVHIWILELLLCVSRTWHNPWLRVDNYFLWILEWDIRHNWSTWYMETSKLRVASTSLLGRLTLNWHQKLAERSLGFSEKFAQEESHRKELFRPILRPPNHYFLNFDSEVIHKHTCKGEPRNSMGYKSICLGKISKCLIKK